MRFSTTITYPAPLARITEMLADRRFYSTRYATQVKAARILDLDVSVTDSAIVHKSSCEIKPASLDKRASTLIPGTVVLMLTQTWQLKDALVSAGKLRIEAKKQPFSAALESTVWGEGETTIHDVEGQIQASVPFVGHIIEREMLRHIDHFVRAEEEAARRYLAGV